MALKIKWKVAAAPTGRYRSFQHRSWPSAYVGDSQIAYVVCKYTDGGAIFADYNARLAKNVSEGFAPAELIVKIADYNGDPLNPNANFSWKQLKARFQNMDDVKAAVLAFYTKNPNWLPKEQVK